MKYSLKYSGSKEECLNLKQILIGLGYDNISVVAPERTFNDIVEADLIEKYFYKPTDLNKSKVIEYTATQIAEYIEYRESQIIDGWKEPLNVKLIGSALKKMEIFRVSIKKADGTFTKGYKLCRKESQNERMARYIEAQKNRFERFGIKAVDYDNPDDFNAACELASQQLNHK